MWCGMLCCVGTVWTTAGSRHSPRLNIPHTVTAPQRQILWTCACTQHTSEVDGGEDSIYAISALLLVPLALPLCC